MCRWRALLLAFSLSAWSEGKGSTRRTSRFPPSLIWRAPRTTGFFPVWKLLRNSCRPLSTPQWPISGVASPLSGIGCMQTGGRTACTIYHGKRLIAYLYQNQIRVGTRMMYFIQAYGALEEYRGVGLGSAIMYRALQDMRKFNYILADIDRQHPGSLVCFRRAAGVHNRHMEALGRYVAATNSLDRNRRPRKGETTRWCLRLKNAPELFPGRLPRRQWPRTANEEDVSATMLEKELAVVETEEQEEVEEVQKEEVVVVQQPKRRGPKPKLAQHKKGPKK